MQSGDVGRAGADAVHPAAADSGIDPPATPTTRTSTLRSAVACDATRTYDSAGRPPRIAATFVDVPPTSITIGVGDAGVAQRAGDRRRRSRVQRAHGRRLNPARSVAPPSLRMTMTGASMPAASTPSATNDAVLIAIGRIEALRAAVTVRSSSPYRPLSSVDVHTGRPARWRVVGDGPFVAGSSGENASATHTAATPASRNRMQRGPYLGGGQAVGDVEELVP